MMSNLINVDPDPKAVKCDTPVEVVFETRRRGDRSTLSASYIGRAICRPRSVQ